MRKSTKKLFNWILGTVTAILIIFFAAWLLVKKDLSKPNSVLKQKLSEKFTEMITEASDSLYKVSYSKFDFDLNTGKGLITDFKLTPDSTVLKRLILSKRAPDNILNISVRSLVLIGVRLTKTERGSKLIVHKILVIRPMIKINNKIRPYNNTLAKKENHSKLFSLVQTLMKLSVINNFFIKQMDLTYINNNTTKAKMTALKNLNIEASGITAMETNEKGNKQTVVSISKNRAATPDSLYYLTLNNFKLDLQRKEATIQRLELIPRLNKTNYFRIVKWAKDRIHLIYQDMTMKKIDIDRFLKKQQIHIGAVTVAKSYAEVYTNYNWPRRTPPVRPYPFPHQQLCQLAYDITIDTMKLEKADTHWRVLAEKSDKVSSMNILNSRGTITNLTNNEQAIQKNPYTRVVMKSLIMGVAPMSLKLKFNLRDRDGAFSYRSTMGKINAKFLNEFAEPFLMMSIKSGTITKMDMQINADKFGASGNIDLYYTAMKVALLKKDKKTSKFQERSLLSVISNAMLPNDNPAKNGKFKKGPIKVKRAPEQSFFGFLSKCIIDGTTSAMTGLDQKKVKKDNNIITKIGTAIIGDPMKKKN